MIAVLILKKWIEQFFRCPASEYHDAMDSGFTRGCEKNLRHGYLNFKMSIGKKLPISSL
jgi:hypothetical protein